MAKHTPNDDHYQERMLEQLDGMLRHLEGIHTHPTNTWYTECKHDMPYLGIPMDSGKYKQITNNMVSSMI